MPMSDNTKKMRHILHGRKMIFLKKEKHTCTLGGERWVTNNLYLVLFKHHWLTRCLHKVTYVNVNKYKENETYTTWTDNEFFKESETYLHAQIKLYYINLWKVRKWVTRGWTNYQWPKWMGIWINQKGRSAGIHINMLRNKT